MAITGEEANRTKNERIREGPIHFISFSETKHRGFTRCMRVKFDEYCGQIKHVTLYEVRVY